MARSSVGVEPDAPRTLLGRKRECEAIDRLLSEARDRHGEAIVVHGDPGIGKTALLEYAIADAQGFQVLRAVGNEAEMALPFAALQQFCAPCLDSLGQLPEPQRDALQVAFGLITGVAPDRLLVGLAMLSLLSQLGTERPLLCIIDDTQWLDRESAQAFAFIARRLVTERIALMFATRSITEEVRGLPELVVDGLGDVAATTLLRSVLPNRVDERVLERFVAEAHGNPLALLELPRGLTPAQLAGGFALPVSVPVARRIEASYRRRLTRMPADSRRLLLIAAAEPTGDPLLVWRASEQLGVDASAAAVVEAEGLLDFGARVVFPHPLVRSAVYQAASPEDRRDAHRALALATDAGVDPDRHAWHRAQATARPDEEVAAELELSAGRAEARGGLTAAAAFMERAAELSVDPASRARRALVAAEDKRQAGA
ncbi:MAG: ATP-dependent transcriptional regulator, MalT-like, LuxR family, partial [Actinomycetia bacterium]|nr:ATP-dependent transcriptional regulator, MalT-like, LuxR family [Actinomycetes bacterium]